MYYCFIQTDFLNLWIKNEHKIMTLEYKIESYKADDCSIHVSASALDRIVYFSCKFCG